ncbi:MAG: ADOP family duplicated permease [Gemmatimonadaceae bacterium]
MSAIRGFLHRLRVLVNPDAYAREVEREIRFHIDLETMQRRGVGLGEVSAEVAARKQFGNVTRVREEVRRMSGVELMDRIKQDVGYAWRGLRNAPGFTAAIVLTLGLGLGVNAAMFTFLDRVFVKPPAAVERPEEVRRLYYDQQMRRVEEGRIASTVMRYPHIREIARHAEGGSVGVFTSFRDSVALTVGANVVPARRTLANTAYFTVLGVRLTLGRYFDAQEDRIETPANVAVISHSLWKRGFAGDPKVIGTTIRIQDRPITIIGVAAEGFLGIDLDRSDIWMPISHYNTAPQTVPAWYDTYRNNFSTLMRFQSANDERRFLEPATRAYQNVRIPRYGFDTTGVLRTGPLVAAAGPGSRDKEVSISLRLGGVALIVLLIAIANVSNLLLVRATRRTREIAVRRALGVSRGRLFEQLFTETALLALLAGGVSILLAFWVGAALRGLLLPRVSWATGPVDLRTSLFALSATLVVGVLVGIAPALSAWRTDVISALKAGSKSGAYRRSGLRSALLIAQAALSIVLLVGAGLFVRSLHNVQRIDLGYDADRVMIASASAQKRDITAEVDRAMPALLKRVAAIPGVEAVGSASMGPMRGSQSTPLFLPGHDSVPKVAGQRGAWFVNVTPGYFEASGLRILAGRAFSEQDDAGVVVNEAMAAGWWPGESAIGKCFVRGSRTAACVPVIGVVENVHTMSIMEKDREAWYYQAESDSSSRRDELVIRADPARHPAIAKIVTDEIKSMVPAATQVRVRSMLTDLEPELRPWQLGAKLFTAMGLLALLVASIGVYSVIAYAVSQRANEMGIRVALGAQLGDITRLVMGEGLRTVAIGIGIGIALALAAGKLVASLLYGISPRDPLTMFAAALVLGAIGLVASVIPALRAARVNPVNALRAE